VGSRLPLAATISKPNDARAARSEVQIEVKAAAMLGRILAIITSNEVIESTSSTFLVEGWLYLSPLVFGLDVAWWNKVATASIRIRSTHAGTLG
jgi:hypothetical protein